MGVQVYDADSGSLIRDDRRLSHDQTDRWRGIQYFLVPNLKNFPG